ncbi:hypothetical protein AALP_AA4G259500 [Arabis alpina]|uniref:Cytochrome p450 n=1 Tax=Arabis alpina TaxID=50452 RepID=A0A087H5Q4_ARAAL|nr:hypothetical protein AALP_AA4G259500 [Arabis alpina]
MFTKRFKKQGITGPKYKIFYRNVNEIKKKKRESQHSILDLNSNDVFPRVYPHYQQWFSQYGETFLYWNGAEPRLCIADIELAKQVLSNKLGYVVKAKTRPELRSQLGIKGLFHVEGADWVRHRRILNPAFSIDRLKIMAKEMVNCTLKMLDEWKKHRNEEETEKSAIKKEMDKEFLRLSVDIIATTTFGSNYEEGMEVFRVQEELKNFCTASLTNIFIPGTEYLPTPRNLRIWKLERKMKKLVKKIVDSRLQSKSDYGDDFLGAMLKSYESEKKEKKLSIEEIIDDCRTIFLGGYESTTNLLSWITMLLSLHQDWQEKLREEIFKECGKDKIPNSDTFSKLKLMNMMILETLRLYGPVPFMSRETLQDMKLGKLEVPKGTTLVFPLFKMHSDKAIWGEDADKFNPMRFENGISQAANLPNALLTFSTGPRACIGQNFTMMEVKAAITMILQRFRVSLSSEYKHAPMDHITVQPQYGLPIMLQPLED